MNVQLYAYEGTTRYELDLYEEQPIKITLSAEEITDPTQINSNFSRQFRIPATNNNSRFFKYWYTSGVVDFDVTQKVTAEIHVDGIIYTTGQLRLVAAYDNGTSDRIDFEVVFLGETKTFSSQVGDGYMSSIDCTDAAHVLTLAFLENSWLDPWNATTTYATGDYVWWSSASYNDPSIGDTYVATAASTGSEPSLSNPDWNRITTAERVGSPVPVKYILADRGYPYDDNNNQVAVPGANAVSEIAVSNSEISGAGTHNEAFTKSNHPLYLTQFTPIVQVKYLIDKIFASTDYSYTSNSVFNEDWFQDLYIDGIATGFPFTPSGNGLSFASTLAQPLPDSVTLPPNYPRPIIFPTIEQNNANAYNATTGIYTCPVNGAYTFELELFGRLDGFNPFFDPEITIAIFRNGSQVASDTQGGPDPFIFAFSGLDKLTYSGNFNAGDQVQAYISAANNINFGYIVGGNFACTASPQQIAVNDLLKTDLKVIDWFKSILTKFRLVMVPTVQDPNLFTILPWNDYIGSGETFDWTYKLDHNKDIKMEPLFFAQESDITFIDQEDIDVINKYQQDTFGQVYGTRRFVSGNELLSGTNEITTEFAPTPVSQIEGLFAFDTQFIVPKLYERGDELTDHGHLTHEPIVPVQRLLFWNGLQPTTTVDGNGATQQVTWYYTDNVTDKNSNQAPLLKGGIRRYPRASYLTEIPTTGTTLNLNWQKQFPYFSYPGAPGGIGQDGQDVYQRYWKNYIDNVYSPQARKMTAYFNLDSEDLRLLTFDDVIWIKDAYWRILKVVDAPLGEVATVKVELIKLLDYVRPIGNTLFDPADYSEEIDVNSGGSNAQFAARQDEVWDAYNAEITDEEISQDDGNQIP
jgi:hypothetical protein